VQLPNEVAKGSSKLATVSPAYLQLTAVNSLQLSKVFTAGILAGGSGSIVGMGGAFIATPALTSSRIALSQHKAQANSLAAVLATGIGGAASFALSGAVDWSAVVVIALGGAVTADFGARLSSRLAGRTMKSLLGAFMMCTAGCVMMRPIGTDARAEDLSSDNVVPACVDHERFAKLGFIGCGVGIFAGVFGVGGGAITVPALSICMPEKTHHEAIGTSCAAMVLPAISGLCRHASTGALVPSVAMPLALGTVCGAFVSGRYVALQTDENTLRCVLAALLAGLGFMTMRKASMMKQVASQAIRKMQI
jgi:uncharacterized membrane protein YfcA